MAGDSLNLIGRQLMNSRDLPVPTSLVLRQALTATTSVFLKMWALGIRSSCCTTRTVPKIVLEAEGVCCLARNMLIITCFVMLRGLTVFPVDSEPHMNVTQRHLIPSWRWWSPIGGEDFLASLASWEHSRACVLCHLDWRWDNRGWAQTHLVRDGPCFSFLGSNTTFLSPP